MTGGTLRQALAFAMRGWPVLPCQPGQKIPATPHGYQDATTNGQQITGWFGRHPDWMPVAWCLADPKLGEREVAGELLAHAARAGALRPGLILIGDKGFAGREFEDLVTTEFKMSLVRPDRKDETPRHGSIGWIRQWIESVNNTLKGQLGLEQHGGRTPQGLYARITQRLLAMAVCIWRNWATAAPVKRSLITYDN